MTQTRTLPRPALRPLVTSMVEAFDRRRDSARGGPAWETANAEFWDAFNVLRGAVDMPPKPRPRTFVEQLEQAHREERARVGLPPFRSIPRNADGSYPMKRPIPEPLPSESYGIKSPAPVDHEKERLREQLRTSRGATTAYLLMVVLLTASHALPAILRALG